MNEKRLKKKFKNEFKDFLYALSGSFSTGRHLVEALHEVNESLGKMYGNDSQIMTELNTILLQLKLTGYDEIKVLEDFKKRKTVEDVVDFVEMYKSCRDTGGDFAGVLSKGANMIAEKITIDREIEAITYQKKIEGRVIGSMPVILLIFLNIFSPDYILPLYSGLSGHIIMTFALALTIFAFAMIERITNIEI
ncbi:MAG: type II secretion system F family protein [Christensenellales bacterium]